MDISEITKEAKEIILAEGDHPPIALFEDEGNPKRNLAILVGFPGPDVPGKCLFVYGQELARQRLAEGGSLPRIAHVCVIYGGWMKLESDPSPYKEGGREVLVLDSLRTIATENQQSMHLVEILRDSASGKVADLLDLPAIKSESILCQAFLAGYYGAELPLVELKEMIHAATRKPKQRNLPRMGRMKRRR